MKEKYEIINLRLQRLNIIVLTTGCKSDGFFYKHKYFKKELNKTGEYMDKESPHINFFIGMHIPPSIGKLQDKVLNNKTSHSLNCMFTSNFNDFMDKYHNRIIAIVTHHLHCFHQENPCTPAAKYNDRPFYLTASGGHCTLCDKKSCISECLKFDFQLKNDLSNNELKIVKVNRI